MDRAGHFKALGARRGSAAAVAMVGALAIGGCGGGSHFANAGRPPTPIDLTVYVNSSRVSVSPASIGAGPVIIFVTNATNSGQKVTIKSLQNGTSLGTTGVIDSGQPAQVQLNLKTGEYPIDTSGPIPAAVLKVGTSRASANNVLLQP